MSPIPPPQSTPPPRSAPNPPTGGLPAPQPAMNPETRPFWEGAAAGRLMLTRCPECRRVIWYPKAICVDCGGRPTEWFEASGRATIHTFTISRRPHWRYRDAGPYVLAYVDLQEGPRVMTNIVDADPDTLAIGQPVTVVFHDTGEGTALPRFRPA